MTPAVAIVIIGRNAAGMLRNVQRRNLAIFAKAQRIVYVDSNSTDQSCNIAKASGWTVVRLGPGRSVLSAAAGRHVGVCTARKITSCSLTWTWNSKYQASASSTI